MEPKRKLTTLAHHIDAVWLREASPVRPPVLGAFGRALQSAVSCHLDSRSSRSPPAENHGTWDRWEDVVICLAFAKLSETRWS